MKKKKWSWLTVVKFPIKNRQSIFILGHMYPAELEIKDTTERTTSDS